LFPFPVFSLPQTSNDFRISSVAAAEEVVEHLKTEKEELLGQVNDLRVELALLRYVSHIDFFFFQFSFVGFFFFFLDFFRLFTKCARQGCQRQPVSGLSDAFDGGKTQK